MENHGRVIMSSAYTGRALFISKMLDVDLNFTFVSPQHRLKDISKENLMELDIFITRGKLPLFCAPEKYIFPTTRADNYRFRID